MTDAMAMPLEGRFTPDQLDNLCLWKGPQHGPPSTVSNLATGARNAPKSHHIQNLVPTTNKRDNRRGIVPSLRKEETNLPRGQVDP
jgi:hypothetical protein